MNFRHIIKLLACTTAGLILFVSEVLSAEQTTAKPNILFVVIDDLNDWVGCLREHPQVKTPHIDRLAESGVLFTNAHVQATFCGPSRMSFLSGRLPTATGAYGFKPTYDKQPALQGLASLRAWFQQHGYRTVGGGKVYHQGVRQGNAGGFEQVLPHGGAGPFPKKPLNWHIRIWDYGRFPEEDQQMDQFQLAQAAAEELKREQEKPLFLAVGFRRPHVPLLAPPKWFDLYPQEKLAMPKAPREDLDDLPKISRQLALTDKQIAPTHAEVLRQGKWKDFVQAYLACISLTDECVGILLNALENGPLRENTIVVLCSDHGWHLGEKQHWAKRTLWEETTRVPLILAGPSVKSGTCTKPVMLLDLYPTLCEQTGIPLREKLDGSSLMPLLANPQAEWDRPAITTLDANSHSIRSERWRYIRYSDGSEELYDHQNDADEWTNLAGEKSVEAVQQEHARWLKEILHTK